MKTLVFMMILLSQTAHAVELGRYACTVEEVYGTDELGKMWINGRLIYDADAGTLDGSFDPSGELRKQNKELPPSRLYSRLKAETRPSTVNNLHAAQYDPVGFEGNIKPVVAWLMIETLDDMQFPRFMFFSSGTRVIVEGTCVHGR